jgi:hypothetical protein
MPKKGYNSPLLYGGIAQLVERGIHKPKVSGSTPLAANICKYFVYRKLSQVQKDHPKGLILHFDF